MGLGNVYLSQLNGPANGTVCIDERRQLADEALTHYDQVLAVYKAHRSEELLADMAGLAHTYRGQIHYICRENDAAAAVHYICRENDAAAAEFRVALAWEGLSPALRAEVKELLKAVEARPD